MGEKSNPYEAFRSAVDGKNILVTGGTGTVGYELLKALLSLSPGVVRVFSRDEQKQFYLREEFRHFEKQVRFLIGDVRDRPRLDRALENVDIVFHLAALKHVESCEYNPFEAIKTNINGTQHLIDAALMHDIETVIFTSSDKAVNPSNAMGASKLMAEKLMVAGNFHKGRKRTRFCSVRFGNVLGSSGSVIPTFVNRIRLGLPIEITHRDMTRFVISFREANELLLTALRDGIGGEIFVRKMPVVRIFDLAEVLIAETAKMYDLAPVPTREIGVRAGEKLYEELVTEEESARTFDVGDNLLIMPQIGGARPAMAGATPLRIGSYSSRSEDAVSPDDVLKILEVDGTLRNPNLLHGVRSTQPLQPGDLFAGDFMETVNAG
ncbi:MAG: SDR family NAD(P)-dependent oxidoreductase [Deltaproteobacteria bacterium]|nr:SDR family NAD(P)-dependent oxidoreductase [Deltaproteobacteria bacterium]